MSGTAVIVRTVVGIIGNIISACMFLSPLPTFVKIWKKGSVEQYSAVPYLATLMNCMVWTLYGLPMVHPHSLLVVTINGAGCFIEIIYITLYFIYSDRNKRLKLFLAFILELIFITLLAFVSLTMVHTVNKRSAIVGTICMLFNVTMYASPLSIMKLVIKTKSVEFMPFYLSLASFGNGVSWTIYALIPFDPFIAIPNGIGTMFAVVQLILYATYYKSTKQQIAARNAKGVKNLSEVVVANDNINKIMAGGLIMNIKKDDMMMGSVPQSTITTTSSPPPHMYPEELQLKLYQAFIFSIPILFSIILFLLFYLFYLKRRASSFSPHLLPRINPPSITYRYYSSSSPRRLDLTVQLDKLPRILFDEDLQARDSLCCVCLGEFEVKEEVLQIPHCKHVFHIDCIHHWLQSNSTCPLCRCSIIPTTTNKFLNPQPPINIIISDTPHQGPINSDSPLQIPSSLSLHREDVDDEAGASSNIMSRE